MSTPSAVSTVTNAVSSLDDDMLTIAGVGLGIGAVIFAVRRGWAVLKGLAR